MWRRFGAIWTAAAAFVLGLAPHFLLPPDQNFYWMRPWYLGMFGIGMLAACVDFRPTSRDLTPLRSLASHLPRLLGAASALLLLTHLLYGLSPSWPVDTLIAMTTALLIMNCVRTLRPAHPLAKSGALVGIRQALERPWCVAVAGFSYTAHLIQHIIFKGCLTLSSALHLLPTGAVTVNFLTGIPVTLALSFFLARYLERPFTSQSSRPAPPFATAVSQPVAVSAPEIIPAPGAPGSA